MRKFTVLKTLLRSPLKTMMTFLLIVAASFALFSKVTDYAITMRESAKAEGFYNGVAALDNSVPSMYFDEYYFQPDPKPWPSDEKLEELSSLPGVTLADTRYSTDGLVEDYKRIIDQDSPLEEGEFVIEGTYDGFEETKSGNTYINFTDVKVYAGEIKLNPGYPMKIKAFPSFNVFNPYSISFFEELEKGSRCLVVGIYSERSGSAFELGSFYFDAKDEPLRVIDGLGEDYLETEEFAWYKGKIEATNQSIMAYDLVYTTDMRAIPYVNEHRLAISEGRPLTAGDQDACVVSEAFLEAYGLSLGDKLHIKLGDNLQSYYGTGGTQFRLGDSMTNFIASAELEIIGAYQLTDDGNDRYSDMEWSYGPAAVFVPSSLLPVEVPKDYELSRGDFSIFIENPQDIEAFLEEAEPLVADMGLGLRFSDGGWMSIKDSFVAGSASSFVTTLLYVVGAALALLLAVYLYIGRNKKPYAIMRTLGVSSRKAGNAVTFPLMLASLFAVFAGGIAGLFYASDTAAKTLAGMSVSSAPDGYVYVLDGGIPVGVVILCLVLELLFIVLLMAFFLRKMKKTPPLELLQEGVGHTGILAKNAGVLPHSFGAAKQVSDIADTSPALPGIDMAKLSARDPLPVHGNYSPLRQMAAYIFCHMRRGIGKTAVSIILAVVLSAGIGMLALGRLSYQEAYRDLKVKGVATGFASSSVQELSKSELLKDLYYYTNSEVRINADGVSSPITFTNDFERYLADTHKITYEEGYDASVFELTGAVCLMGQELAESLGVGPGDEVKMMSDDLYSYMVRLHEDEEFEFYEDEEDFRAAVERAGKPYRIVGILESENKDVNSSVFSSANDAAERIYGQPFEVAYCEFFLADNERPMDVNSLLEDQKNKSIKYAPMASFRIDTESLKTVKRIRSLLESLFPIAVAAAVLMGVFGSGLIIMQSAQESAFLRILGVTKKRACCMLALEQILLCIVGILFVAGILALFSLGQFARGIETIAFCWMLYFLGCACGALTAAVQVTRHKVLDLLQVRE